MGESDRLKNYISDYLDNTLDPTTHKEFEKALNSSADLRTMTHKVSVLKSHLNSLSNQTCSDDFSLKLRERIHTEPQPVISRQNLVRLSFAASFVLVLVIATFSLTDFSDSTEVGPPDQKTSDYQNQILNPTTSNPVSGNNNNVIDKDSELEIKTKTSRETLKDSTRTKKINKNRELRIQQVDKQK